MSPAYPVSPALAGRLFITAHLFSWMGDTDYILPRILHCHSLVKSIYDLLSFYPLILMFSLSYSCVYLKVGIEETLIIPYSQEKFLGLLGEPVISSVLSLHSRNLKWRTSVMAQLQLSLNGGPVLQLCNSSVLFDKQRRIHSR